MRQVVLAGDLALHVVVLVAVGGVADEGGVGVGFVGGVVVRNLDALILPDSQLSQNLLGMTFLSRLKRFEYANGKLVLEQ